MARALVALICLTLASCGVAAQPSSLQEEGSDRGGARCPFAPVEPTYLPWLARDEDVPGPNRSYDRQIDRAQESWTNPQDASEGVGLTLYTLNDAPSSGRPVGVKVEGVQGRLHQGDGDEVSAFWALRRDDCNFLELVVDLASSSTREKFAELKKIARSFERR